MCFLYHMNFAIISLATNGRESSEILTYIANILQTFRCSELVDSLVTYLFQSHKPRKSKIGKTTLHNLVSSTTVVELLHLSI